MTKENTSLNRERAKEAPFSRTMNIIIAKRRKVVKTEKDRDK